MPLKDNDLDRCLYLDAATHDRFWNAIRRDALFLNAHGTMDYSLLVGLNGAETSMASTNQLFEAGGESIGLLTRSPATSEFYRVGIIDYLVAWGISKKLEQTIKGITYEKVSPADDF